jgi:hypothetical protein
MGNKFRSLVVGICALAALAIPAAASAQAPPPSSLPVGEAPSLPTDPPPPPPPAAPEPPPPPPPPARPTPPLSISVLSSHATHLLMMHHLPCQTNAWLVVFYRNKRFGAGRFYCEDGSGTATIGLKPRVARTLKRRARSNVKLTFKANGQVKSKVVHLRYGKL